MKRVKWIVAAVLLLAVLVGVVDAGKMRWAVGLTGGGDALDGIVSPSAGDTTMVFTSLTGTSSGTFYLYYAVTDGAAESSPDIITPNTNANAVNWYLLRNYYGVATSATGTGFMVVTGGSTSVIASTGLTGFLGVSNGTMGVYSSFTRTITDWRQDLTVSLTTSTTTGGQAMFVIPYAISSMAVSAATNSTGTTVATVDWKKCGTSNWTTCTSMLSSAISPTNTTGVLATMGSTTVGAGERMLVSWGTVTVGGTNGAVVTYATGTAAGVQ